MPLYEFECTECGYVFDEFLSVSNRHVPIENGCPKCNEMSVRSVLSTPPIADPVRLGRIKPSEGFRDLLKNIKKRTPGAIIDP